MKSSNLHSQRQILPLDVGRADFAVVGDTEHFGDHSSRYTRRRIAAWARVLRGVKLGDLRIGSPVAKIPTDRWTMRPPRIGTDLRGPVDVFID